jgi:signal recognition particle receptor subunit beta
VELAPTVGLSTEKFRVNGSLFTCYDMSGAKQYRALWRENLDQCEGVIFVVDSSDTIRLCVAASELEEIMRTSLLPHTVSFLPSRRVHLIA